MANRFPNTEWNLADERGNITTWDKLAIAVLMDIRDELRRLNRLLHCSNFTAIPNKLDRIAGNTRPKLKKVRKAKTA